MLPVILADSRIFTAKLNWDFAKFGLQYLRTDHRTVIYKQVDGKTTGVEFVFGKKGFLLTLLHKKRLCSFLG